MSGLICLNWYDWNLAYSTNPFSFLTQVGIDLPELIRLKLENQRRNYCHFTVVGIDLPELIRLKPTVLHFMKKSYVTCRDLSAWIDTIETLTTQYPVQSSLWSRDWSALIDTIETSTNVWACFWFLNVGRDWSAWIDTIETIQGFSKITNHLLSGLICLNWYDWNMVPVSFSWPWTSRRDWSAWIDTIETLLYNWLQGRDLLSGLICLNWYDWNLSQRCSRSTGSTHCRDWSAWIDTIETIS